MTRKQMFLIALGLFVLGAALLYKTPGTTEGETPTVVIAGVSLTIEYATTPSTRARGLSGRAHVPEGYGMVFVFPKDDLHGFWMKDTLVPLDLFWLDAQGQVVHVERDVATSTYPRVFYPEKPARYVLETAAGFARTHGISIGMPVLLKNPPVVSK